MILSCQNISKAYGMRSILHDISFHIEEYEKAAVVGINGAGKSTLLKIITGELEPDSGQAVYAKGTTVGYLSQLSAVTSGNTIYDEVLKAREEILQIHVQMHALEEQIAAAGTDNMNALLDTYARLTHIYEDANGYAIHSEVTGILKGLGFKEDEFSVKVDTLSGGQKTRVALGRLLLSKPDILLLDEPTNHLDMQSVAWLEGFLKTYPGAVLIVAHDRYFLDRIVTKIIEIENHTGKVYDGNYTAYAQKKAALRDAYRRAWENQQREIRHQEEVITKLKSFNREKSIKRAESREKLLSKVERLEKPQELKDSMRLSLAPRVLSGNDVLSVEGLAKSFDGSLLFSDVSMDIKRGERAALIGNNGTGKTTILKIINGMLAADSGEVHLGAKVTVGYYDQEHQQLSANKTIFEEISDAYPRLDQTRIRNVLAAFLFTGDDVFKKISDLSGGERGRVSLARLMLSDANLLILDEPTNHLDIVSREILEEALRNYTGTVLYVSHDRYFINMTATRILDLADHRLHNYPGNYDNYLEEKERSSPSPDRASANTHQNSRHLAAASDAHTEGCHTTAAPAADTAKTDYQKQKAEAARRRKRQNDIARIEVRIEEIEQRTAVLDGLLTDVQVYTDPERLLAISDEKETLEKELIQLMEEWENLYDD